MADVTCTSKTLSTAKDHRDTSWLTYHEGHAVQKLRVSSSSLPDGEEDKFASFFSIDEIDIWLSDKIYHTGMCWELGFGLRLHG
jgi:hypothetical protein